MYCSTAMMYNYNQCHSILIVCQWLNAINYNKECLDIPSFGHIFSWSKTGDLPSLL